MKVLHLVNEFDPSCDVLRCVRELNRYSRHSHTLVVLKPHPLKGYYQFEEPEKPGWQMRPHEIVALMEKTDVIIHQYTGWENGYGDRTRPSAFRNICIYWDQNDDRFWTTEEYNAKSYGRYKLVASSHVGATDFLPADRFRWLPDLLPLDGDYAFAGERVYPAVSFIKHASELQGRSFGRARSLNCAFTAHRSVLAQRRFYAPVVIDNVCDGHYGLAGQEAAIMGLPVVVFNHPRTLAAMKDWEKDGTRFPFTQAASVDEAFEIAVQLASEDDDAYLARRREIRAWAEEFFDPRRLIEQYWDPFVSELASWA